MFAIDYRPKRFQDVVGHTVVKKVFKAILKNPSSAPEVLLLVGEWGCGKTTVARIFGKYINCTGIKKPCYKCPNCMDSTLYHELDSSIMGNVQDTRRLQETLYYSIGKGYRVIVIDEIQVASKAAESSFLKVFENPPERTFFLLLTTNPEDVLKTIISRSMELNFYLLSDVEISKVLATILQKTNQTIPHNVMNVIVRRADGHARDAVILLEMALMVGAEDFIKTIRINDIQFTRLFEAIINGSDIIPIIDELVKSPISYLRVDLERSILSIFKQVFGNQEKLFNGIMDEKMAIRLLSYYTRFKPLLQKSTSEFYSTLLGLKTILTPPKKQSQNRIKDRFSK